MEEELSACTRNGFQTESPWDNWDDENPHAVFISVHQARFNVNICGGILGDYLLVPVIIPARLNLGSLPGIPPEHASAAHGGDIPCDTQRNVVPTWWRSSALQPPSTSTSEQSLQGEMDMESGTCRVASKIARPKTPRFFSFGGMWKVLCTLTQSTKTRTDWANIHWVWSNQTQSWHVCKSPTGNGTTM